MSSLRFLKVWQHLPHLDLARAPEVKGSNCAWNDSKRITAVKDEQVLFTKAVLHHSYLHLCRNASFPSASVPTTLEIAWPYAHGHRRLDLSCLCSHASGMDCKFVRRLPSRKLCHGRRVLCISRYFSGSSLLKDAAGSEAGDDNWLGCTSRQWSLAGSLGRPSRVHCWFLQPQNLPQRSLGSSCYQPRRSYTSQHHYGWISAAPINSRRRYGYISSIIRNLQCRDGYSERWPTGKAQHLSWRSSFARLTSD